MYTIFLKVARVCSGIREFHIIFIKLATIFKWINFKIRLEKLEKPRTLFLKSSHFKFG